MSISHLEDVEFDTHAERQASRLRLDSYKTGQPVPPEVTIHVTKHAQMRTRTRVSPEAVPHLRELAQSAIRLPLKAKGNLRPWVCFYEDKPLVLLCSEKVLCLSGFTEAVVITVLSYEMFRRTTVSEMDLGVQDP